MLQNRTVSHRFYCAGLPVPVIGLDVVGKGLRLNVRGVVVAVVVVVVVYRRLEYSKILGRDSTYGSGPPRGRCSSA
jgi:hypothetical protein